ncbi:type IV toxin-antitoxin system AbiEi family antitoxin [Paraburkholderia humisilvae]|uniref:type IV toxin-antitoxin system AbiEi family antitoxin n=1 Tax=Paraburkholderia humisilvae TaxID=627669 RepID=UPI001FEAB5D8|nr:type IV toxin-antitoxin system AbiEi family antitoxin [Paraburkholderia humisilvae]
MIDEWTTLYPSRLRGSLDPGRFRTDMVDWWRDVPEMPGRCQFGGESVAAVLTGYLKPFAFTLCCENEVPRECIAKACSRPDRAGNIKLLKSPITFIASVAYPQNVAPSPAGLCRLRRERRTRAISKRPECCVNNISLLDARRHRASPPQMIALLCGIWQLRPLPGHPVVRRRCTARDILLTHVQDIERTWATADFDIGISIESRAGHDGLRAELLASCQFERRGMRRAACTTGYRPQG